MKLILVNQRYGHKRTIVIRGWMKGLLSLCLLGAPVALGYLGYELALADGNPNALVSQEAAVSSDEFISSHHSAVLPASQPAYTENAAGTVRSSESVHYALTAAASVVNPLVQLVADISGKYDTQTLLVFAHGRLIDPAVYFRHTLH
ncbi:MAG: hypothetical protein Q7W55_14375 [Pseudohongiella sp.]|nr:hypothetical protein [Pseudohongiella sp.]MDO9520890.1 hypothetical protein [Pseudohongiella sp.]MDP2128047.1 hypothetical protein [Pseudohongiella sp.]